VLHDLMRAHPLATLVTGGAGGLMANVVPISSSDGTVLRGHLARNNTQLAALREADEALAIFQGPQAYVRPGWFPSKDEHGKVVPTWNYAVVQVRGTPTVIDDPAWLREQVEELTFSQEGSRSKTWHVGEAPPDYIDQMLSAIVGFEIAVTAIEGKWKVSQNRAEADRMGVAAGLEEAGEPVMSAYVRGGGAMPR